MIEKKRGDKTRFGFFALTVMVVALAGSGIIFSQSGCDDEEENCQVQGGNCRSEYLQNNGLTGCCSGLTCKVLEGGSGVPTCRF